MSEALRIGLLFLQLGASAGLILWTVRGTQKFAARHQRDEIPMDVIPKDVVLFCFRILIKVLILIGVWVLPTRFAQNVYQAVNPFPEAQERTEPNRVYKAVTLPSPSPTPDRIQRNREQNEKARERFRDL